MNKSMRLLISKMKIPATFENDILVNTTVSGFDHNRNIAKVKERGGTWTVRKYNPEKRWFGEEYKFDSVEEAVDYIEGK